MWSLSHEDEKSRARRVTIVPREDPEELERLEALLRSVPNFLPVGLSLADFVRQPGVVVVLIDNVGMLAAESIIYGKFAQAHITFWDGKLEGRESLCEDIADFVMECAGLQFLLTTIPTNRKRLLEFAEGIGFRPVEVGTDKVVLALMNKRGIQWE